MIWPGARGKNEMNKDLVFMRNNIYGNKGGDMKQ